MWCDEMQWFILLLRHQLVNDYDTLYPFIVAFIVEEHPLKKLVPFIAYAIAATTNLLPLFRNVF